MLKVLKLFIFLGLFFPSSLAWSQAPQDAPFTFGGEVPWPLSSQKVVTVENARGLWRLEMKGYTKLFNVEMISHSNGLDWIRVSELDSESYKVISWGEGFFRQGGSASQQSSYSNIQLGDFLGPADRIGRYIYMFPNGDIKEQPYLIRLVEVETSIGHVLGLSVIRFIDMEFEHMLGRRVLATPLPCYRYKDIYHDDLECHLNSLNHK
jgi:hypothetical protein